MTRSIPDREALTVEFKRDTPPLRDSELIRCVVALANTQGGQLYLGVEDDGRVTGVSQEHRDAAGLAAVVGNRTVPPVGVRARILVEEGVDVLEIEVPRSLRIVATTDGTVVRRRLKADGRPEDVPFLPHEFPSRESSLGQIDYSAMPVAGVDETALDPLERRRLRGLIEKHGGDRSLLALGERELDGALGLVRAVDGVRRPTVVGLLLLGREAALREHLPTHEVAFQVLEGTEVKVNEFFRGPLLAIFERVEEMFGARIEEREVEVGLFRVPVPSVDRRAFREALANALTHRDYARMGTTRVRFDIDALTISNPGGFVEGVTLENLLVVEPRPRNPALADAFKRVGLAERTGRGVDRIFEGMLRYGRPGPDYGRSDATTVIVRLSRAEAQLPFLRLILEEERRFGSSMPVEALIVVTQVRDGGRVALADLAAAIHKDEAAARRVVERLIDARLLEPHGSTRGRTYTLAPRVYRTLGKAIEYVRDAGLDAIRQEQAVLQYVASHGQIRRGDVMNLCGITRDQAYRLLKRLEADDKLKQEGDRRAAVYARGPKF